MFDTLVKLVDKGSLKFNKAVATRKISLIIKSIVLIISITFIFVALFVFCKDFDHKSAEPVTREVSYYSTDAKPFDLMICVPVDVVLPNKNGRLQKVVQSFEKKSFEFLEKATDDLFNRSVGKMYLQFNEKIQPVEWKLLDNVIFMDNLVKNQFNFLYSFTISRCFRTAIRPKEARYQSLVMISKLLVIFKHHSFDVFILRARGEIFFGIV